MAYIKTVREWSLAERKGSMTTVYVVFDNGVLFCSDYETLEAAMSDATQLGEGFTVAVLTEIDPE